VKPSRKMRKGGFFGDAKAVVLVHSS